MSDSPHRDNDHLLSIPPYFRPSISRHHSSASIHTTTSARPHAQHRDYAPILDGVGGIVGGEGGGDDSVADRWMYDQAEVEADAEVEAARAQSNSTSPLSPPSSDEDHDDDWNNARDGSIARRPAWRRPSPKWIYPFIIGSTLSMGMGMAPRSELYISLACLAHPPQQPSSYDMLVKAITPDRWSTTPGPFLGEDSINATLPVSPKPPVPRSAADEWFIKIQHDIYEYKLSHHLINQTHSSPAPSPSTSRAIPSAPLPHPTSPSDGGKPPVESPPVTGEPEPDTGREAESPPYNQIDPALCKHDPKVQAAAARLTMIMTLAMGVLSALTTGYWGSLSDRVGRTKITAVVETGLMLNEMCFILVATFPYLAPGGYRALLIGPTIDGLLGGFSTISATIHAYLSDVTPDGSRATVFARLGGIMMTGFACGPVLGSFVIRWTDNIMFPFYVNVCVHALYIILMLFLLPESLSTEARSILSKNAMLVQQAAHRRDAAEREWENETPDQEINDPFLAPPNTGDSGWSRASNAGRSKLRKRATGNTRRFIRRLFKFLEPLAIFLPREKEDGQGKDWTLTKLGCAMFSLSMMWGIMQTKTQYTFYAYNWTSAQLGPFMSLMGFSRGFVLLVLVPVVMHYAKPLFSPNDSTLNDSNIASGSSNESSSSSSPPPIATPARRSSKLDLYTIRFCLTVEASLYLVLASNVSSTTFVIVSTFLTIGSAGGPAFNSLALSCLPSSREAGRLFGALSVIHSLAASLLSPLMFGTLFSYTVGIYAPTVFALGSATLFIALFFVSLVRLPEEPGPRTAERGRSRNVKRVKSSGAAVGRGKK